MWATYLKGSYWDHNVRGFWLDETDFMRGTMACGPAEYCGRWWLNSWISTFADGVRAEHGTPLILTRVQAWRRRYRHRRTTTAWSAKDPTAPAA